MPAKGTASPWTERLLQLVEEAPRERQWLLAQLIGLVPPGRAWRRREWDRVRNHKRLYPDTEPTPQEPNEDRIRYGARAVVWDSFNALRLRGRLHQYQENGVVMVAKGRGQHVPTPEERSAASKKSYATWVARGVKRKKMKPEAQAKRLASLKRFWANKTPEERAEWGRKTARIRNENSTPEQRAEWSRKAGLAAQEKWRREHKG